MRIWGAALAGIAIGLLPGPAVAQRAGAERGRFEVPGLDWAPNSAWRARAAAVRQARWDALRRGDLAALNRRFALRAPGSADALAVTGTFFVPVVAIEFSDAAAPYARAQYQAVLFDEPPPDARAFTLKTYYEQVSNGNIQMFGSVFPPVRTDTTHAFYENGCNGIGVVNTCPDGGTRFGLMLIAALDSISNRPGSDTTWSRFDNDGPDGIPNSGDDDGDVDFVTFLQPLKDGACSGSSGIWAHRFVISAWNGGSKYVTKTPRRNAAGQPIPGEFIRVNNYTIQSQVGGGSGCDDSAIMPIGTVAHETGHAFGLPDLYDTDRSSGTEGIGEWGIMGSGNYAQAYSPAGHDPWSLHELGWVTVDTLAGTRVVTTGARQFTDTVFFAKFDAPDEYLLIENRQAVESDSAGLDPNGNSTLPTCRSRCRKMPGLLLWHIDLGRIATGRGLNRINTGGIQGVALEQADGLNQLRSSASTRNRGDAGDPYPGSTGNTRWSLASAPSARSNFGEYAGFIIDRIGAGPGPLDMTFRFLRRQPTLVRSSLVGATVRVNGQFFGRFEDVVPQGEPIAISVDSLQEILTGRTRARWTGWNIGGPRTQTIVSGAVPDTVLASFQADHRVLVQPSGAGTGTVSSPAGETTAGIFVPEGQPVTVTATAGQGSIFGGWRGDTTSSSPTLVLPMGRPYDIEALFLANISVAVDAATAEILGTPTLTTDQRMFLDQLGNKNGLFDLGDYLALLARNGQAVPAAVLEVIGRKPRGTK
ncbi:MAG: M6 family metalloprotease domain-containing protein [Gemmatimonadales bacterium]